jgi:carboxyl-terminal processing protease
LLATGLLLGFLVPKKAENKFEEVLHIVDTDYVDTPGSYLKDKMISEFLSSLDPHSKYVPSRYYQYMEESLQGQYEGVGLEFRIISDTIYISRVVKSGPAHEAGLIPGDIIVAVGDDDFQKKDIGYEEVITSLRGKSRSKLVLTVIKKESGEKVTLKIKRRAVLNSSVKSHFMINKTTGYIKFSRFSTNSYEEYMESFNDLTEQGMKSMVIDLRGNGGGYLREAMKIANEFLEEGEMIAYIRGRKRKSKDYIADGEGKFRKGKLILILNHYSASASEILAGALKDQDRALIIGSPSYGKGLVQEPFYFTDSSSVKLTVARYYIPSGRCIQKEYGDHIDESEKDSFYTLKKNRLVFGKSGITPDITFPMDTFKSIEDSGLVKDILMTGCVEKYLFQNYLPSEYKDPSEYFKSYNITEDELNTVIKYAQKEFEEQLPKSDASFRMQLSNALKRKVAYTYYGPHYYFYVKAKEENLESFTR